MARSSGGGGPLNLGGMLGNLTDLIEKLGELAEKGEELRKSGEFGSADGVKGVYGFTIKSGLGGDKPGFRVEPFGNVKPDRQTGKPVVEETLEPVTDVFEEADHVLVTAEMPGVGAEDVKLEVAGKTLLVTAERGRKKYRKEVDLPVAADAAKLAHTCRNGVLEVKLTW